MYKCRICGNEYMNIEDVINCEQKCLHTPRKEVSSDNSAKEKKEDSEKSIRESKKEELQKKIDANNAELIFINDKINALNNEKNDLQTQISIKNRELKEYLVKRGRIKRENCTLQYNLNNLNKQNTHEFFINGEKVDYDDFYKSFKNINEFLDFFSL